MLEWLWANSSLTWLLWVSAHRQSHGIPWRGYCLTKITICEEGTLRGADNAGPARWDVVLRCRAPAVNHRPCDWSVRVSGAGGWGLLQLSEELLVWREVVQLVFVLLVVVVVGLAVESFSELCIRFLLHLFLVVFLSICIQAEGDGAVGVVEVFGSIMQAIAQVSLWGCGNQVTAGHFGRRCRSSSNGRGGAISYSVLWIKALKK